MAKSQVETLSASTVKTISVRSSAGASWNLQEDGFNQYAPETKHIRNRFLSVEVINVDGNVDGSDAVYFTVNGVDPTVEGDDTYVLPIAGSGKVVSLGSSEEVTVKAISEGTPTVYVRAG